MITVCMKITTGQEPVEVELNMSGHAYYNKESPKDDIVCAAASMLGQTFEQALMSYQQDGSLREYNADPMEPGKLHVYGKATGLYDSMRVVEAARVIYLGFEMLAEEYPDNVELVSGI